MKQLAACAKKYFAWFPIVADDEMLAAAEPLEEFLRISSFSFCATGRGRPKRDQLEYEIAFDSQAVADQARCDWLVYRYCFYE